MNVLALLDPLLPHPLGRRPRLSPCVGAHAIWPVVHPLPFILIAVRVLEDSVAFPLPCVVVPDVL
jgi:hypothetical protein